MHSVIINQEERFLSLFFLFFLVIVMCGDLTESSAIKLNDPCRTAVWLWGEWESEKVTVWAEQNISQLKTSATTTNTGGTVGQFPPPPYPPVRPRLNTALGCASSLFCKSTVCTHTTSSFQLVSEPQERKRENVASSEPKEFLNRHAVLCRSGTRWLQGLQRRKKIPFT